MTINISHKESILAESKRIDEFAETLSNIAREIRAVTFKGEQPPEVLYERITSLGVEMIGMVHLRGFLNTLAEMQQKGES